MHNLTVFGCKSMLTWVATSLITCVLAEDSAHEAPQPDDEPIEEIIVTGTRLPFHPTDAVTVLSRRDIERGGANSIGDVLLALPQNAGSPLNTNVNMAGEPIYGDGRGDGSVRIALRGHSTLVLLNGRRFPNSGADGADTSVDLNTLPISFVDRIEVLPSGASAIYGADAVGGVVNVITRRDLVGITLAASQTLSEHGDGQVTMGQAAGGLDLFGGTWFLGAEHVAQDGVRLDRRGYSEVPLVIIDGNGTLAPFGNRATPDGRFEVPGGNALGLAPGIYTRVEGATGQTAADYRLIDPAVDFFNIAPYNYSQTPNERSALWLIGSRPLGERVNVFVEGLVHHRESAQQTAPSPYFSGPLPGLADGSGGIPADHYYNPFGVDLVRAGPPVVSRRFVELGNRSFTEEVDLWRVLIGLEGAVAGWGWTLSVGSSKSDAATFETGAVFGTRFIDALGPSGPDESGHIVCGVPDAATGVVPAASIISGCVPVNLFGGAGTITPDQLDYVSPGLLRHTGTNEEQIAELVLKGSWGQLSGRDLHWVVGLDYRREVGRSVPDPSLVAEGEGVVLTGAEYDTTELFLEGQFPLLRDRPIAREVDLSFGLRWSNASSFDSHLSWQAGLHWQPLEEWSLHANYADVFTTPALWLLHDPQIRLQGFDIDPCGNDPAPIQRENCSANGVPGGAYVQDETEFEILAGGNPHLEPETGHSIAAGVLYTPRWMEGLSLGVDFNSLELSNLVGQLSVGQVLFECAEHGLPQVCDDIQRFPHGHIRQVSTFNENFGGLYETRSFDFAIEWAGSAPVGDLNARLLSTYLARWDEQPFLEATVFRHAGRFDAGAMPRWRSMGTVDWNYGRWLASYGFSYIGSYSQLVVPGPTGNSFEPYTRRIEPVLYQDIEVRFEFGSGITIRAAITNLTDEDPPYVNLASPANTDPGTYRLLGRSYFLELRYDFAKLRE